ncbi:hypothetical protein [Frankia sp. Cr1]|uniref:hypothetical protein n=1 Tax=Frankia sp. Cr1 TaxID=3073931 RepID=UPI002AD45F60|nr:hypothetical protein [Frankia sp. Cr1]
MSPPGGRADERSLHDWLLDAIGELRHSHGPKRGMARELIEQRLLELPVDKPEVAAGYLATVVAAVPGPVRPDVQSEILRRWMRRPNPPDFDRTWDKLSEICAHGDDDLHSWLAWVITGRIPAPAGRRIRRRAPTPTPVEPTPEFRHLAAQRLRSGLDGGNTAEDAVTDEPLWQLFALLDPAAAPVERPDRWCFLGDRAREHGGLAEAEACYAEGVRQGSRAAKERLAYVTVLRGRELMIQTRWAEAEDLLAGAVALHFRAEYQLLRALTQLLGSDRAGQDVLDELESLRHGADSRGRLAGTPVGSVAVVEFWVGVAQFTFGDRAAAGGAFRRCLDARADSADPALLAAAQLLGAALAGDTETMTETARILEQQWGTEWASRCIVTPRVVIAAATYHDPVLAERLAVSCEGGSGHLVAAQAAAAHRKLGEALTAAREQRVGAALRIVGDWSTTPPPGLDSASQILVRELSAALTGSAMHDRLAYEALEQDGQRQPWTEDAGRRWEQGGGPWRIHHLAIVHHSRAYDLETAGDPVAFDHWQKALRHWATLYRDDALWELLRRHMEEASGGAPSPGLVDRVDRVREALPDDLLTPHVTRILQLASGNPGDLSRARRHVEMIIGSTLPTRAVEWARERLIHDVVERVMAVRVPELAEDTVEELGHWLTVDPTNLYLGYALLFTSRMGFQDAVGDHGWWNRISPMVTRVQKLVEPFRAEMGTAPAGDKPAIGEPSPARARFEFELARLEFWMGWRMWETIVTRYGTAYPNALVRIMMANDLDETIAHFTEALRLDPDLPLSGGYYREIKDMLTTARGLRARLGRSQPARPSTPPGWRAVPDSSSAAAGGGSVTADSPWVWRNGWNPYRSNPFQVLDLPSDLTDRAEIRARIRRRRIRIERAAERYPLFGRTLQVADVNRAEEQISDVAGRLRAVLLSHRPERTEIRVTDLCDRYEQFSVPTDPLLGVTINEPALGNLLPGLSAAEPSPLWEERARP